MLYHVIIALNGAKKRKVGTIIKVLERKGLDFIWIAKKSTSFPDAELALPSMRSFIVRNQVAEFEFVKYYKERFSYLVLERKFNYFLRNHVELFFESEKIFDPDELWNACRETFESDRKVPILLVIADRDENGEMKSFIPTF